ncbi:hypothetical protein [Reinekea blandensis]|uniref:Uncharacterized protein n=1 Tax=Reinekea blandensis MED297 TaxID=314283 RepID=A4BJ93_9GAMM|nr:hypothetical protein [Reinekea blandensis]EAR07846.1 hypothetical protein MED297_05359 [Reinekea sp. MED297] [Reinekea blandensis MED297]
MPMQRIFPTTILTLLCLFAAGLWLQSPYQLWILMALLGLVTGTVFLTGQRHVITGFGLGIAITLLREIGMYGPGIIEVTGLVYAAGYLFAVATTISMRTLRVKFSRRQAIRTG